MYIVLACSSSLSIMKGYSNCMRNKISPIAIYLAFSGATSLLFNLVFTISSIYYIEIIGVTAFQLVLVGTVLEIVYFVFEVPTGVVADVYSRRLSIIIGTMLTGFAFILEGAIPAYLFVLISQILWGLGATFLSGATEAWIADFLEEDQLERIYIRAAQTGQVCALVGIGLSVALATISIQLPIILAGLLFIILSVLLFLFMPESIFTPLASEELNTWGKMASTFSHGLSAVKKSNILKTIFLITLVTGLASEGFDRLWTAHFIENFVFPKTIDLPLVIWFGIINGLGMIVSIISSQVMMKKLEKNDSLSSVKVLFSINLFHILSVFIFAKAGNFNVALMSYLSIYMLRTVNRPIYSALIARNVSQSVRSTVISSEGQINSMGQIIGGPIIGIIAARVSISAGILATSIILLPSIFLHLMILKEYIKKKSLLSYLSFK